MGRRLRGYTKRTSPSSMKTCITAASALVLALFAVAPAWGLQVPADFAAQCERRLPATKISVTAEVAPLVYDFTKSVRDLTQRKPAGPNALTLGLTERHLATGMEIRSASMNYKGEKVVCMRPEVEVTLTLAPHTVFVGREFPQKSCAFGSILQHEQRHVLVNNLALKNASERLEKELLSSFGNRVFYGERADLERAVGSHIQEWMTWLDGEVAKVDRLHQSIDSPSEYAKNNTVCSGEIPRVLKASGLR